MDPDLDTHLCREKVHGGGTRALLTEGHETLSFPIVTVGRRKENGERRLQVSHSPSSGTHTCMHRAGARLNLRKRLLLCMA